MTTDPFIGKAFGSTLSRKLGYRVEAKAMVCQDFGHTRITTSCEAGNHTSYASAYFTEETDLELLSELTQKGKNFLLSMQRGEATELEYELLQQAEARWTMGVDSYSTMPYVHIRDALLEQTDGITDQNLILSRISQLDVNDRVAELEYAIMRLLKPEESKENE